VNHTFTSHLALSASLQPFAGLSDHVICEYPFAPKPVALAVTKNHIELDSNGHVSVPHAPGLGMIVDETLFSSYLVDLEIIVEDKLLYKTPSLTG
jgi:L-alanine-DL-glutamate epimerase-like enolase superfamily enzyme